MPNTLINGGTVIDGTGNVIEQGSVLIEGERIAAVGSESQVEVHPAAAGARIVDAHRQWVIPGLIDSHIHATLTGIESMPVFLACGVTTVRDVGGPLDVVAGISDQLVSGAVPGPRFMFCGPLIDGEVASFPDGILPIISSTKDAVAAAELADSCIARGASAIKLYFRLPLSSVRAVIERVDRRVPVTGHLGRTSASEAVEAGINGFEHVIVTLFNDVAAPERRFDAMTSSMADINFWGGLLAGWAEADLDSSDAQRILAAMRERDVTLDPTLDITRSGMGADALSPPRNQQYVRQELAMLWAMVPKSPPRPPEVRELAQRGHAKCDDFVRRYHETGGRVTAGTDVGAVFSLVPGFSLHDEMQMLVRAGLSTTESLRAATLDAAVALRIDADTGSIEPGKIADLVILDADPLADIANVGRMSRVYRAGEEHDPAALLASQERTLS